MTLSPYLAISTAAALSSAAVGGLFYAFSTFTMRGLDRLDPHAAIVAMRGINAEAQANAPFLLMLLGSALLALVAGVVAAARWREPGSGYVLAGAVLAVLAVLVTIAVNVPLNNRLDALDVGALSAADAARDWSSYLSTWMMANHVRAAAPLLGSVLLLVGARHQLADLSISTGWGEPARR